MLYSFFSLSRTFPFFASRSPADKPSRWKITELNNDKFPRLNQRISAKCDFPKQTSYGQFASWLIPKDGRWSFSATVRKSADDQSRKLLNPNYHYQIDFRCSLFISPPTCSTTLNPIASVSSSKLWFRSHYYSQKTVLAFRCFVIRWFFSSSTTWITHWS